jgi:hypothetical protein
MQRRWSWGWFCLLLSVAAAQSDAEPLEQVVSFREPAQRVQQILQTLSLRTQTRLVAAHEVKDEIVLVDAESLTLRQVMDNLALALDAEWQPQPDGSYRLSRPVKRAQQRRALENERRAQLWRQELEKRTPKNLVSTLTEAEARPVMRRLREQIQEAMARPEERRNIINRQNFYDLMDQIDPTSRLLYRLLSLLDLSEFTLIPVGEQRVYSTRRGVNLLPFKKNPEPALLQFLQEKALTHSLARDPNDGVADLVPLFEQQFEYNPISGWDEEDAQKHRQVPTVYLRIIRWSESLLEATLHLTWGEGFERDVGISLYQKFDSLNLPAEIKWRETPVSWSELGRLQLRAFREAMSVNSFEPFQPINPARVEPLSLVATDILRTYAQARQKPIFALVPDYAVNPRNVSFEVSLKETPALLSQFEEYLAQWEWIEGAALVAKPRFASYWWNRRYPRPGVDMLVERVKQRGYVDADDYFTAVRLTSEPEMLNYADWWFEVNNIELYTYVKHNIRLLEAMGAALWQRLQRGETLLVSDLPPPALKQLQRALYEDAYGGFDIEATGEDDWWELLPVFFYPNGLPPTTQIHLKREETLGFFSVFDSGVWSNFRSLDYAHEIAKEEIDSDAYSAWDGYISWYIEYLKRKRRFLSGSPVQYAREIDYRLELIPPDADELKITLWLPERYELLSKPTRWNEPPEAAKAAFEEAQKRAQQQLPP